MVTFAVESLYVCQINAVALWGMHERWHSFPSELQTSCALYRLLCDCVALASVTLHSG